MQLQTPKSGQAPEKWDGRAAERIVETLVSELRKKELETAEK